MFSSTEFTDSSFSLKNTQAYPLDLGALPQQRRRRHSIQELHDSRYSPPLPSVLMQRPLSNDGSAPIAPVDRVSEANDDAPPVRKVRIVERPDDAGGCSGRDDSVGGAAVQSDSAIEHPGSPLACSTPVKALVPESHKLPKPHKLSISDYHLDSMRLLPPTTAVREPRPVLPSTTPARPTFSVLRVDLEDCLTRFLADYDGQHGACEDGFGKGLQQAVAKVFSPRPEPPYFSEADAQQLFASVCQGIEQALSMPEFSALAHSNQTTRADRIKQAAIHALGIIEGVSTDEPSFSGHDGPLPQIADHLSLQAQGSVGSDSRSESEIWGTPVASVGDNSDTCVLARSCSIASQENSESPAFRMIIPALTMSIEKKCYSQPLPGQLVASHRWTLIYLIHKHQPNYHPSQQLRFVEHVPGTLAGDVLADDLCKAAQRGLRLQLVKGDDGREVVNWHPELPAHEHRDKPFPHDGVQQLQAVLSELL